MKKHVYSAAVFTAVFFYSATVFATQAVPPPAGSPAENVKTKEADIENNAPTPKGNASAVRFTLTEIRVEHEALKLSDEKLTGIVAPYVKREISEQELFKLLVELTGYARSNGYPVATAYIPEQTAVEGKLLLRILPGRLGSITVKNESRLSDNVVRGVLARLKEKQILHANDLESAMYHLEELSGVHAQGVLSAGKSTGETDLTVKLTNDKPLTALLYTENYGSRSAGRYRYGLATTVDNIGGTGGRISLGGLISNGKQHAYSLGYEMPVGHSVTKLGVGVSRSDYELGSIFSELGAKGVANTYSFWGETPIRKTAKSSFSVIYGFDYRKITDEIMGYSWDKHSTAFHAGISGSERSDSTNFMYRAEIRRGNVAADSQGAEVFGRDGRTLGVFWKGVFDITAVQRLGNCTDIMLKAQGQKASRNLDSSEEIYLGGAHGVRAYPQGEASGDEGVLGTLELRYHTPMKGLVLSVYLDAGHVSYTKDRMSGSETLKGWGIGITYSKENDWFARFDYARRIGSPDIMSNDAKSKSRLWFMLGKMF